MAWGHKVTITVYVEGDLPQESAELSAAFFEASEAACKTLEEGGVKIDGAGVRADRVEEQPKAQVAT